MVVAGCYQFVRVIAIIISLGIPWNDSYDMNALSSEMSSINGLASLREPKTIHRQTMHRRKLSQIGQFGKFKREAIRYCPWAKTLVIKGN